MNPAPIATVVCYAVVALILVVGLMYLATMDDHPPRRW